MPRNLIISGGIFHPFEESSAALSSLFAELGIESEVFTDVDAGVAELDSGAYDMVSVNALRWGMMTADKYEPFRTEWAYRVPEKTRGSLTRFVHAGGALLGLHTASICFDDWPGWGELLGGHWQWGISHHPPLGRVRATPSGACHPIVDGIREFDLVDEIYHDLALQADVEPLLFGNCGDCDGAQPILWARTVGDGRVVYDALGHDAASIGEAEHRRVLQSTARWLLKLA